MAEVADVQVGVKAFILDDSGRALYLQRSLPFEGEAQPRWDIPGGRVDVRLDNQPYDGLAREIDEETGLSIVREGEDAPFPLTMQLIERQGRPDVVRVTCVARLAGEAAVRLSGEHSDGLWLPRSHAKNLRRMDPFLEAVVADDELWSFEELVMQPGFTLAALQRARAARWPGLAI